MVSLHVPSSRPTGGMQMLYILTKYFVMSQLAIVDFNLLFTVIQFCTIILYPFQTYRYL